MSSSLYKLILVYNAISQWYILISNDKWKSQNHLIRYLLCIKPISGCYQYISN